MNPTQAQTLQLPAPFDVLSKQLQAPASPPPAAESALADVQANANHLWSENEVLAIAQAWASQRPLLIRGEAGCGKSQLAQVVSTVLGVPLFKEVIHPRFEATDLLFKVDHVRRLADAQMLGALASRLSGFEAGATVDVGAIKHLTETCLPEGSYITPGVLKQAFEADASSLKDRAAQWPRAVVLIDEIDKADTDLPNALLGVLGSRSFKVPGQDNEICCTAHHPLVLITTNEDRELPAAFVRRCAVLNIKPPTEEGPFQAWLVARALVHAPLALLNETAPDKDDGTTLLQAAARQVWEDREEARNNGYPTVGLAEYIDLLYALYNIGEGQASKAWPWLTKLSAFALVKHKEQDQGRASAV